MMVVTGRLTSWREYCVTWDCWAEQNLDELTKTCDFVAFLIFFVVVVLVLFALMYWQYRSRDRKTGFFRWVFQVVGDVNPNSRRRH